MFERFTRVARAAVVGAQQEAVALGHDEIFGQHVLLSLMDVDGVAARVLRRIGVQRDAVVTDITTLGKSDAQALNHIGIDLDAVRSQVEAAFGPGALDRPRHRPTGRIRHRVFGEHLPFSADAKTALEQALREAQTLQHNYIGTEHILLGLVANQKGPVAGALRRLRVAGDYEAVKAAVLDELARMA
jgi:ATP-dependent Clp protease ATP-binding subunit ClpA